MTFRSKYGPFQLAVMWQHVRRERYRLAMRATQLAIETKNPNVIEQAKQLQAMAHRAHINVLYYTEVGSRRVPSKII